MQNILSIFLLVTLTLPVFAKEDLGFLFFGDSGTGKKEQLDVAKGIEKYCLNNRCDFALLLGDNIYPDGVKSVTDTQWKTKFETPYKNLKFDFFAALGNHDYLGKPQAEIDYTKKSAKWKMPSRYYTFTKKNAQFFVLDTEKFDEVQLSWFKNELAKSIAKWKIVYGHHPIYSYGEHGNTQELVDKLLPEFKGLVDYYLSGHDHDLQFIAKDSEMDFIVSGAAAKLRDTQGGQGTIFSQSTLGFAHMSISGDTAIVKMLDKNGKELFSKERRAKLESRKAHSN